MVRKRHSAEQPGVILLMALLFMAAITASVVGISVVVNSSIGQSRNVDNYILASLAADSGLERGLAVVRVTRNLSRLGLADVLPCISTHDTSCYYRSTPPEFFGNDAVLRVRSTESLDPVKKKTLQDGEVLNFDLFNLFGSTPTFPKYIKVVGNCLEASCNNLLEVSWSVVDAAGTNAYSNREFLSETSYETSSRCLDLTNIRTDTADAPGAFTGSILGFRVRVRALRGSVDDVSASAFSDLNCTVIQPIVSRIRIESTGTSRAGQRETRSIKEANVLWTLPASGVFNYVVFSEESLIP